MRTGSSLVLGLFAASAYAAPGACKQKKAVCNADNCLRAVRASSAKPYPSVASADCNSFMMKTVTPCASTTTTTKTVTVTAAPVGVTVTNIQPQTQINTVFQTITSVIATIEDTATIIQPSAVVVTNIIPSAVTVTAAGPNKRAANLAALPTFPAPLDHVEARAITTGAASTCPATTKAPTAVPTYASACSGTARYSSACSCAGYTGGTTTVAQPTVTSTATSTSTVTPINTAQITLTTTVPVTVTQVQTALTTFETTDATLIVPSVYTVVTNVVVPTTVVVSPPVCSSYNFVVTSGNQAGSFIAGDSPENSIPYGFVLNNGDAASALSVTIRPDGTVYSNNVDRWMTRAGQLYYVLHAEDQYADSYNIDKVFCSVGQGDSSYPGAIGALHCTSGGHAINFYSCPSTGNDLVQGTDQNSANYGCSQFSVAAVPAC